MTEDATTDSTLTEGDDLTEIFRQSNVQGTYQSLSANTGFFVRGPLLKDYVPTPMKSRPKHSWVWIDKITKERHGVPITYKRTGESLWMCFHCFNKTQKALLTKPATPTTLARRHLMKKHGLNHDGTKSTSIVPAKRAAEQATLHQLQLQQDANDAVLDKDDWKSAFIQCVVRCDLSLRVSSSVALCQLATYRAPLVMPFFPKTHQSTRDWLVKAYQEHKSKVINSLKNAQSRITLSFDG